MRTSTAVTLVFGLALTACGGASSAKPGGARAGMDDMMTSSMAMGGDDASAYAPLDVGADWAAYLKVNTSPVRSETHGGRLVDTYVNDVGAAAYLDEEAAIPVGTVLVKASMERDGSAGPIFVMEKRAAGTDPDRDDWSYAIHWADPPARWQKKLGGPIYWRTPSKKAEYCHECHSNYDRGLGLVPASQRIESAP